MRPGPVVVIRWRQDCLPPKFGLIIDGEGTTHAPRGCEIWLSKESKAGSLAGPEVTLEIREVILVSTSIVVSGWGWGKDSHA